MPIYVTYFCPRTKQVVSDSEDSGFNSIDDVVALMGPPLSRGKRTATYRDEFYSDYAVRVTPGIKHFLNRG